MKYKMEFTEEELNVILRALGKQPYEQVFLVIDKIKVAHTKQTAKDKK